MNPKPKTKILRGYGIDVKIGDYVGVIFHNTGYFGPKKSKKPQPIKQRGILKVIGFQLRGNPSMLCENSKGNQVSFHYRGILREINGKIAPVWHREFVAPTKRQIKQYKLTRSKHND